MAQYNAIKAAVNAYIKANGRKEITGQILNSVLNAAIDSLGKYFQFAGEARPDTDPGTPDQNVTYLAGVPGTYTNFGGLVINEQEVALLMWNGEWVKHTMLLGIREVIASVDNQVGTPSVDVNYEDAELSLAFHNIKGDPGQTGAAAGFGSVTADVDANIGTPGVSVVASGADTSKNFAFHFTNLKGQKGDTGVTAVSASVDNNTGVPYVEASLSGQTLVLAFHNMKGAQGDTGSNVDYPYTLVNNVTTNDATQGLSAAMGVYLQDEISQLDLKVDGILVAPQTSDLTSTNDFYNSDFSYSHHGGMRYLSDYYLVKEGTIILATIDCSGFAVLVAFDSSKNVVSASSIADSINGVYIVPSGVSYLRFQTSSLGTFSVSGKVDGIVDYIETLDRKIDAEIEQDRTKTYDLSTSSSRPYYGVNGTRYTNANRQRTDSIKVSKGDVITYGIRNSATIYAIAAFDKDGNLLPDYSVAGTGNVVESTYTVPNGVATLIFADDFSSSPYVYNAKSALYQASKLIQEENSGVIHRVDVIQSGYFDFATTSDRPYYGVGGTRYTNANRQRTIEIPVVQGDKIVYQGRNSSSVYLINALDSTKALVESSSVVGTGNIVSGTYSVPAGISYVIICDDFSGEQYGYFKDSIIKQIDTLDKKIDDVESQVKTRGAKLVGFSKFTDNAGWTLSADNLSASTSTTGFANRFQSSVRSFEDTFEMGCSIVPVGTSFEVGIGKFFDVAGTMFILRKDGTGSYLDIYNIESADSQTLSITRQLSNVSLTSGSKYYIVVKKVTNASNEYAITITDSAGNVDSFDIATALSAWGYSFVVLRSGTNADFGNFSFGYHIAQELDLVIFGHSWVEGNSISSQKDKRFASFIREEIGEKNVLILGHGGESATGANQMIGNYSKWFKNARYFLMILDINGLGDNPSEATQLANIATCESIAQSLEDAGIIPVWICGPGPVGAYQNGVDNYATLHSWQLSQPYVVDIRDAFISGNSNDATKYLPDQLHPTIASHQLIYNCIRSQASYLFDC